MTQQLVEQTSTDEAGRFKFTPSLAGRAGKDNLVVVVRHEGLATLAAAGRQIGKSLDFVMPPAATLKGTVRDAGRQAGRGGVGRFRLIQSVTLFVYRSKAFVARGPMRRAEFAVTDLEEFKYKRSLPPRNWHGGWVSSGPPSMTIVHPDYARTRVKYDEVPADVDVVLSDRAGTIEGQVVAAGDRQAGRRGDRRFRVRTAQRDRSLAENSLRKVAQTGPDGRYRVTSLPERIVQRLGQLFAERSDGPGHRITHGPSRSNDASPVMRLVKAGVIEGRIVDEITGKHGAGITVHLQGIRNQKGKASSYWDGP